MKVLGWGAGVALGHSLASRYSVSTVPRRKPSPQTQYSVASGDAQTLP